jgi:hypothetical protein
MVMVARVSTAPIVWLTSPDAASVRDERIVARDFDDGLETGENRPCDGAVWATRALLLCGDHG